VKLRVQPSIRFLASPVLAIFVAAAAVGTASSGRSSVTASPSLVWSTWVWVEKTQGQHVQQFTLWIGDVDGSPRRLLGEGRDPKISPDGRWIAFSDSQAQHTYVIPSAGGRPRLVARNARPGRWSPTSRYLTAVDQGRALYVTDIATRRRVTIDRGANILGVSFSPTGKDIVWGRQPVRGGVYGDADVFRARLDGSQRIRLTRGGKNSSPVWGPRQIAFARARSSGDKHYPVYELWTMRPSGKGLKRVTRTSHAPVEWSGDGRRLLTSTYSKSGSVLSVIDMETGAIRRPVIRGQFVIPLSLSKDGRSVLTWSLSPVRKPEGDLVRVDWNARRTTLVRNAGQFADWNL